MVDHIRQYKTMLTPELAPLSEAEKKHRQGLEELARRDALSHPPFLGIEAETESKGKNLTLIKQHKESNINE